MTRDTHSDRSDCPFGQLLDWHLERGTRPEAAPECKGAPWRNKEFATAIGSAKRAAQGPSERTIRNWRNSDTLPEPPDLTAIVQVLFGGKPTYAKWQAEITEKYHDARDGRLNQPAPVSLPRSSSLPAKPLRCFGRSEELKSILDVLVAWQESAAALVLGGPGMGKTTLIRQAATDPAVIERFGNNRWFVELETARDLSGFEIAVAHALGLESKATTFDIILDNLLARTPGLLILDNLETPWVADVTGVEQRLAQFAATPGLTLLASMRGGEAPAGMRWTRRKTVEPLETPHDRDLFLDIAHRITPNDPDLPPLLAGLGGVPLAIELVAMQAQAVPSLRPIHDEWQRVGSALAQRPRVLGSRLTSLDTSLELSVASPRLGADGRRLFGILGQLPAGIAVEDLSALLHDRPFAGHQDLLSSGLAFERGGRLDLLQPVRDHARRLYSPTNEDAALWRSHYVAVASKSMERIGSGGGSKLTQRLMTELPNLIAARDAAFQYGDMDQAATVAGAISRFVRFIRLGEMTTIPAGVQSSLDKNSDRLAEANTLESAGDLALADYDFDQASRAYELALPLYRKNRDILGEANCIKSLGNIALRRFDQGAARKAYEQALPLYRQVGDVLGEANCIRSLGYLALRHSDHGAARRAYEEALALYRQIGAIQGEANCIKSLGDIALAQSNVEDARKAYAQALPLYRQVGDVRGEANCIRNLGHVAFRYSNHNAARTAYEQALLLYRQVGDMLGEANCIKSLGNIALAHSDQDNARKAYQLALDVYERIHELYSVGWTQNRLADLAFGQERSDYLAAARKTWTSIDRLDLVDQIDLGDRLDLGKNFSRLDPGESFSQFNLAATLDSGKE